MTWAVNVENVQEGGTVPESYFADKNPQYIEDAKLALDTAVKLGVHSVSLGGYRSGDTYVSVSVSGKVKNDG